LIDKCKKVEIKCNTPNAGTEEKTTTCEVTWDISKVDYNENNAYIRNDNS
jgi:hypothetical protein